MSEKKTDNTSTKNTPDSEAVSDRIRTRITKAGRRFFANDNIHEYIEEGELEELKLEVEKKMRAVLEALVIDIESDHNTQETARRVTKMYLTEVFGGRYICLLYTSPSPRDQRGSRMPSSA